MVSKVKMFKHTNNVLPVVRIIITHVFEQSYLDLSLFLQLLLVPYNLQCNIYLFLVVKAKEDDTEAPLPQLPFDLESEGNVVSFPP